MYFFAGAVVFYRRRVECVCGNAASGCVHILRHLAGKMPERRGEKSLVSILQISSLVYFANYINQLLCNIREVVAVDVQ